MKIIKALGIVGLSLLVLLKPMGSVFAQDEESFVRRSLTSKKDAIVLSVIYPGLGQMTAGQKYKGISLFVGETVSLLFAINSHENYNTKQKVYDKDFNEYNQLVNGGSFINAKSQYEDLKDRNDELDNLHTIRNTALIAAAAVYAYNIIDSVFFSPTTGEGERVNRDSNRVVVRSALIDRNPGIILSKRF